MQKKALVVVGAAAVMSLASAFSSFAGDWKQDEKGWWYQNDNGSYTVNDWQQIDGKWYHFDESGYMQTGWQLIPRTYTYMSDTYTQDEYYYFAESGEMLTDKAWEGGCLLPEGVLVIDEVGVQNGVVSYWRYTDRAIYSSAVPPVANMDQFGRYTSSLGWKNQLLDQCNNGLRDCLVSGSFNMDYQLPANWADDCPTPLMTGAINYLCYNNLLGEGVDWNYEWVVDDNNVFHIRASSWPSEE